MLYMISPLVPSILGMGIIPIASNVMTIRIEKINLKSLKTKWINLGAQDAGSVHSLYNYANSLGKVAPALR